MSNDGLDRYQPGGYWRISDRSGQRYRASDTVREWNGAIVGKDEAEPRHEQEFIRSKRDDQSVPQPRPPGPLDFIGPADTVTTADAAAAATSITVSSSAGFHVAGRVAIMLDNNDRFLATISSLPDSTHIAFTPALSYSCASGATVIDYTAPTAPDL